MAENKPHIRDDLWPRVISLDVGGTLALAMGPTITGILCASSHLPNREAKRILRGTLHVSSTLSERLIADVCAALQIPRAAFPDTYDRPQLATVPGALDFVNALCAIAPVVTLSNVTCLDFSEHELRELFGSTFSSHYASCVTGYAKPDARAFRTVAERHAVPIGRLVHIGDSWECDARGALDVGARAVWIRRPGTEPGFTEPASARLAVVHDLAEAVGAAAAFFTDDGTSVGYGVSEKEMAQA